MHFENWNCFFLLSTSKLHKTEWDLKKNFLLISSSDFPITPKIPKNSAESLKLGALIKSESSHR